MKEQLEKLIEKYSTRFKALNENITVGKYTLSDDEYKMILSKIHSTDEILKDLKKIFQ